MEDTGKTIEIKCRGNRYIDFNDFKAFQGRLKTMTEEKYKRLKALILKLGWIAPVFVWNGSEILDGHGRLLVLGEMPSK